MLRAAQDKSYDDIYQLKITLLGADPEIWRRVLAPSNLTLRRLHGVIQAAMGWRDVHLHDFRAGKCIYGEPEEDDDPFGITRRQDERKARMHEMLRRVGSAAVYTYDFGDNWQLRIVLERRLKPDPNITYPVCTDGRLAGPPEDCGGVPGFYELVEAFYNANHERHRELLEWVGEEYDPARFSIEEVNRRLHGATKRIRR